MNQETTSTAGRAPKRQKITARILKFSDHEAGFKFTGVLMGTGERPWNELTKESGEVREKIIPTYLFEDKETKERITVFGDAGLVNAMTSSGVNPGDWIEIEKLEKVKLDGGKTVNQYDIYQLT